MTNSIEKVKKFLNESFTRGTPQKIIFKWPIYIYERFSVSSVIRKVKNKASTTFYYADKDLEASNSYVVEDVGQMGLSRSLTSTQMGVMHLENCTIYLK